MKTVTYGSEFVAARIYVEQIIDLHNTLCYLGVPVNKTSYMFGDNESVVNSSNNMYSKLTKRHKTLSYNRIREAIASGYIKFHYIPGKLNLVDILSKHWSYSVVKELLITLFHFQGDPFKNR